MERSDSQSVSRLATCESEIARLTRTIRVMTTLGAVAMIVAVTAFSGARSPRTALSADTLRVREVAVVDAKGVVRARLGGDLPDAVGRLGRQIPRGDKIAGLLIYDDRGRERGGYVTFEREGTAALTLDSRDPYQQMMLIEADSTPAEGVGLRLWSGKSWAELHAGAGGAGVSAGRDGRVVFFEPPAAEAERGAFCRDLKTAVAQAPRQVSPDEVLTACRAHRTEKECTLCLGKP